MILPVYGAWQGPNEVLSGAWGKGDEQFGIRTGDIKDFFPTKILIMNDGKIVIDDRINKRLKIYQSNGLYLKSIKKPGLGLYELEPDKIISFKRGLKPRKRNIGVYSITEEKWLWINSSEVFNPISVDLTVISNNIFLWDGKEKAYKFSPTGELIQTYNEKPSELGKVKTSRIVSNKYKSTFTYQDAIYNIVADQPVLKYYRDLMKYLYRIETFIAKNGEIDVTAYKVHKYSTCGKEVGFLNLPLSEYEPMPEWAKDAPTWVPVPVVEYGEPIVSNNGDVYCWARTKTEYKILKWIWQDDPKSKKDDCKQ